ncbi:hypothetical protein RAMLITH_22600 [Ramlibacter sp. RBP-2]|uniref:SMODS-associating 2TM beta-strand rich effector domain-containing protein n=1 Tax=Ramlibacter lithotrophicus TaxID=2606681 RepID=A0A7X6DK32_9BURK|nr:hypothetical protein [Ramlibacter lithotrophicus]NKE68615.1 hypothetical protein [Ramlibacter lithotrophicus]
MTNLTLTRDELTRLLIAFSWAAFLFAAALCWWNAEEIKENQWRVLRYVSMGMTGATAILFVFTKWAWKLPWVAQVMGRSIVHGVWAGRLKSDFQRDGAGGVDVAIVFLIRQTYLTLSIRSLTRSMRGSSTLETLIRNEKTQETKVSYVFRLDQPWKPGGKSGAGAGELELESGESVLRGVYWTDSPTHGTLRLQRVSEDIEGIASFEDALRRYPEINHKLTSTEGQTAPLAVR